MKNIESTYTHAWYINQFNKAQKRALEVSSDGKVLFEKPDADTWSPAQCVAHLNAFGNLYYDNINSGMERAAPDQASPSDIFKPRLFWRGVIRIFEPPYSIKFKTLSIFEPDLNNNLNQEEQPFKTFVNLQDRFIDQLQRCRQKGFNLNNTKVSNPALTFVKMTLAECYAIIDAHQRRHLWQAEQVLERLSADSTR